MPGSDDEKYPWHLLRKTILLLNCFMGGFGWVAVFVLFSWFLSVFGLTVGTIGPTLLDLKDLLGVSIGEISFILTTGGIGSLVGCFLTGFLLDKLPQPHYKYLILAGDVGSKLRPGTSKMSTVISSQPYSVVSSVG